MKFMILFSFLFSVAASAQTIPGLEKAIANDLDALFSDTVNEGEMSAKVKIENRRPSMKCILTPAKNLPNTELAKCEVDIKVKVTGGYETLSCQTSCFVIYKITNKDLNTLDDVDNLTTKCIENVATTDCQ